MPTTSTRDRGTFLKMADERAALTSQEQSIPRGYRWADLASPQMEGVKLEQHYRDTLAKLGMQGGMLGIIFEKAQNKIQDPHAAAIDESLEDSANLPDPHILAQEIADDLRSALGQIEDILGDLERRVTANDTTPRGA